MLKNKILIAIFLLASVFVLGIFKIGSENIDSEYDSQKTLGAEAESNNKTENIVSKTDYRFAYFVVDDPSKLELIANFSQEKKANDIVKEYNCRSAINGGFYTKESLPLGLFESNNYKNNQVIKSSLVNGFLLINDFLTPMITDIKPDGLTQFILQSGPLLIVNAKPHKVISGNADYSRRSVAVVSGENKLYFFVFYKNDNKFLGPKLDELPEVLVDALIQEEIPYADAINLDGGSASFFKNDDIRLTEVQNIGSLFCLRN